MGRRWEPPRLNRRVELKVPQSGRLIAAVWAARFDRKNKIDHEENVSAIYELMTTFVIRHRHDVPADVEIHHGGQKWESSGPPMQRGVTGSGRGWLVILAKLRR